MPFVVPKYAESDAALTFMNAKYHDLFWRPVTAIDPWSVANDGFGAMPGPDDGNPLTTEQPGWRPLLPTPNHPEYSTVSAAPAEVVSRFMGTDRINVTILDGRVWAGLHYRFSTVAGIDLGKEVADYDLAHAFSTGG